MVVVLHESVITLAVSGGILVFRNNSIFVYNGCCIGLFRGKVNIFDGSSTGEFTSNCTIMGNQTCIFLHGITMIPEHCSSMIFAATAHIKLNGGNE